MFRPVGQIGQKTNEGRSSGKPEVRGRNSDAALAAEGNPNSTSESIDMAGNLKAKVAALEAEAALYRHALESLRQDMQAFAYSVSHDLRAPLRAIQGFSKILVDDFSTNLEPDARNFLEHIIHNTEHLSSQMEDLLLFYRLGKNAPRRVRVEVSGLVQEVFSEQKALQPGCRAELEMDNLPEVTGDPDLLRQAFAQLIANSLKATRGCSEPSVSVRGNAEDGVRTYAVGDNGVGFEMRSADRLFQVFQKLHSPEEFPGNGIGLAIVKRIVLAHGGCVRAESAAPGKGARFLISLPHGTNEPNGVM